MRKKNMGSDIFSLLKLQNRSFSKMTQRFIWHVWVMWPFVSNLTLRQIKLRTVTCFIHPSILGICLCCSESLGAAAYRCRKLCRPPVGHKANTQTHTHIHSHIHTHNRKWKVSNAQDLHDHAHKSRTRKLHTSPAGRQQNRIAESYSLEQKAKFSPFLPGGKLQT